MKCGNKPSLTLSAAVLAAALAVVGPAAARADQVFMFAGTNGDGATDATADFVLVSPSVLQLTLTNTAANTSQGTSISGLNFDFAGFSITGLTSVAGTAKDFDANTSTPSSQFLKGATGTVGKWQGNANGVGEEDLTTLGNGQPFSMIIGAGGAPNGNTKNFEPYIDTSAVFLFTISSPPGSVPTVSSATFFFGTGPESSGQGSPPTTGGGVPEPASLSILGCGAAGLLLRRRIR